MINLTLPTSIDDCTPEQLSKWLLISDAIKTRKDDGIVRLLEFQCQLLSIFSGVTISKIKKGNVDDIQHASRSLIEMFARYEYKEPSGNVTIDGVTYVFEKDFRFISTGQIIDLKLIEDISENPSQALAICYIEQGKEYCDEDERGRVVNPTSDRMKIFKENFPGEEFLNFFGFFLRDYETRSLAMLGIQTLRMKMTTMEMEAQLRTPSGLFGRLLSINYQKRWERVWKRLQDNHM